MLADFDWHRIWTLNIDDIVETALNDKGVPYDRFDWTSAFRDSSTNSRQIVHLHGFVKEPSTNDSSQSQLVFSIQQYAAAIQDMRTWHAVFTDEFTERPFIVLGASLIDEIDLQEALVHTAARTSRGFPSIAVLKSTTALERDELAALGLLVVEAEAETFMSQLHNAVQAHRDNLRGLYGAPLDEGAAKFLQQFIDLRTYAPNADLSSRNFYGGYEPTWGTILEKEDATFQTTERAITKISTATQSGDVRQEIHMLTGGPGTGKSTGLLRVASQLVGEGLPTFQFRGDEELDVFAALQWLRRMPKTVLIIDGCAEFADSIGELAEECSACRIPLRIVGAERSTRRRHLEQEISHRFLNLSDDYEYDRLSDEDIDSLIDKLRTRRRLGRITRRSLAEQRRYFRSFASRRLFEGMANLEGGLGFQERIRANYQLLTNPQLRGLYEIASMAYQHGYEVPLGVASRVSGIPGDELGSMLSSDTQDRMLIDRNGVKLPHRITASLMVDSVMSRHQRFVAMHQLLIALAPHVDVPAIRKRTRAYRLVRQMMNQESVMRLLGPEDGRRLYDAMEAPYDWNGRYWDQRALFESELEDHDRARSYAEHSLTIQNHPFAHNTLGTILGRIAVRDGDVGVLREAMRTLEDARDSRGWDASEHPYVTFFTTMNRFGNKWGLTTIPSQLRGWWSQWFRAAETSRVFSSRDGEAQLERFRRDWLYLAVD